MDIVKTQLRLPADLHAKLVAMAKADRRSLNSQIVVLLEQAATERGGQRETQP